MKADQPLLELIALKNAINEIEREITIPEERRQPTRHIQIGGQLAFTFRTGRDRFVDGGSARCVPGGTRLAQLGAQPENVANGVSPDRFARRRREIGRQPLATMVGLQDHEHRRTTTCHTRAGAGSRRIARGQPDVARSKAGTVVSFVKCDGTVQ